MYRNMQTRILTIRDKMDVATHHVLQVHCVLPWLGMSKIDGTKIKSCFENNPNNSYILMNVSYLIIKCLKQLTLIDLILGLASTFMINSVRNTAANMAKL